VKRFLQILSADLWVAEEYASDLNLVAVSCPSNSSERWPKDWVSESGSRPDRPSRTTSRAHCSKSQAADSSPRAPSPPDISQLSDTLGLCLGASWSLETLQRFLPPATYLVVFHRQKWLELGRSGARNDSLGLYLLVVFKIPPSPRPSRGDAGSCSRRRSDRKSLNISNNAIRICKYRLCKYGKVCVVISACSCVCDYKGGGGLTRSAELSPVELPVAGSRTRSARGPPACCSNLVGTWLAWKRPHLPRSTPAWHSPRPPPSACRTQLWRPPRSRRMAPPTIPAPWS
jgi:hypothetical protein